MAHPDRIIPVSKLPEGLRLCAQNVRDFVVDAENAMSKGHGWHAIALAIFAFEELGKYYELKRLGEEARKNGLSDLMVKDNLFRSHTTKQIVARKLVPSHAIILLPESFDKQYFDSKSFQTEPVTVSPNLRLECAFVDWLDGAWTLGAPHDTERIKTFLNSIMDALNNLTAKT